jgi:hypothetical protein
MLENADGPDYTVGVLCAAHLRSDAFTTLAR